MVKTKDAQNMLIAYILNMFCQYLLSIWTKSGFLKKVAKMANFYKTRSAARRSRCERMKRFQKLQGDPGLGLDGPGGPEEP